MKNKPVPDWQWKLFHQLTTTELYALLRLRQQVFIVEQASIYPDIDGHDTQCVHLLVWENSATAPLLGSLRIVPAGLSFDEISIGRIVTAPQWRGRGLGSDMMSAAIDYIEQHFGRQPIRIGAQYHLSHYYRRFGFRESGTPYEDGGIKHIEMLRKG